MMGHSSYLKNIQSPSFEIGDIDVCLKNIHDVVEEIITEPACTAQVFGSPTFDKLCEAIGNKSFHSLPQNNEIQASKDPVVVYLVTKLQKSGGHTRVLENFITASSEKNHIILVTEIAGSSDKVYIKEHFSSFKNVQIEFIPKRDFAEKLLFLQKRLLEINPETAYLFNHHQDSVAVAAIQPEMNIDTYFYHHGDHHLCLGVYLSHAKHIDIHPMGYHNCRENMGIDNVYIPLTVDEKDALSSDHVFMRNEQLITCTAARSNKIEVPYGESYLELIPEVLAATKGKHVHIGRLTPWGVWKVRRGMRRLGVPEDRFVYVPWVQSVWEALSSYHVDIYLSSFPYSGALTLIEAMGAGVPVVIHRHSYSRLLSCLDLVYPAAFSWATKMELLSYFKQLNRDFLAQQSKLARQHFETFHRNDALVKALKDKQYIPVPDLKPDYQIKQDEWGFYLLSQISWTHILYRGVYRLVRTWRAKLQQLGMW